MGRFQSEIFNSVYKVTACNVATLQREENQEQSNSKIQLYGNNNYR